MLDRLEKVNTQKLGRRLRSVGLVLSRTEGEGWRERLAVRIAKRAKRFTTAVSEAGLMYAPDRLHRVRIAAKKLRYALELAADSGVPSARGPVRALKRAQDTLGRLNDLRILQHHIADVHVSPPERRGGPDGGLDAIDRALEEECRHLHARYLATYPALVEIGDACRTAVPAELTRRARQRARPLKMPLGRPRAKGAALSA
jgi:hypothetical protein